MLNTSEQLEVIPLMVTVSIVEAPFTFFEMQIKCMSRHAVELLQASFGKAPKALDAVDVAAAKSNFVGPRLGPKVFGIPDVEQAVIVAPTVAVNGNLWRDAPAYIDLQRGFFAVRHDFGVDLAVSLQKAKDRCF